MPPATISEWTWPEKPWHRLHLDLADNGRQFVSGEFEQFTKIDGIRHTKTSPYNPSTNGLAERYKTNSGKVHPPRPSSFCRSFLPCLRLPRWLPGPSVLELHSHQAPRPGGIQHRRKTPDLQSWIFGTGLVNDQLAILVSAKSRIYRYFVQVQSGRTSRQRDFMVWGAIAYDSRSPLIRSENTMMAQRYVDDVLRPETLSFLQGYQKLFSSRKLSNFTQLASANMSCMKPRCFHGHQSLLISHL
ncbi:K02A2.6-like [Cordylochernes scorpioides]|uniref:K02A2.6-like n=1 Tax=Cordylochernes scorpioides TaxID=51811 RepID=A0ABY6LCN8_9ARAC|nr:K02A2.6-like [Cordylochernes scorpioides]